MSCDFLHTHRSVERLFAAESNLARFIDIDDTNQNFISLIDHVSGLVDTFLGQMTDVHQTFGSGEDFDECTKINRPFSQSPDTACQFQLPE